MPWGNRLHKPLIFIKVVKTWSSKEPDKWPFLSQQDTIIEMAFEVFFSLIGYRPYWRPGMYCLSHLDTKRPCLRVSSSEAPSLTGFCFTPSAFPLCTRSSTTQPQSNPQPRCLSQKGHPGASLPKLWSDFHGNRFQTGQRIHSAENLKSLENDKY